MSAEGNEAEGYEMGSIKQSNFYFRVSCVVGVLLSCYALIVELKKEKNDDYEAYCDINEYISCTKAFASEYGKGFGIIGPIFGEDSILNQPNSMAGMFFYLLLALMSFSEKKVVVKLQMIFCIISNFLSIYLAYILYFILYDLCVICVGTYIVNAINLILCIKKWNLLKDEAAVERKKSGFKKKE